MAASIETLGILTPAAAPVTLLTSFGSSAFILNNQNSSLLQIFLKIFRVSSKMSERIRSALCPFESSCFCTVGSSLIY